MEELALDVDEEGGGAEAEEAVVEPVVAELLLHKDQPRTGVLRRADAAGRLEAHNVPGALVVVANSPLRMGGRQLDYMYVYLHGLFN